MHPKDKIILSLCDYSGIWSDPYRRGGYQVYQIDPKFAGSKDPTKLGYTAEDFLDANMFTMFKPVYGILAAPPCTHFALSGSQYWQEKDNDGRTAHGLKIVDSVLKIVNRLTPKFWALENPIGRLPKMKPELQHPYVFDPHEFGGWCLRDKTENAGTKKTYLWGKFNRNLIKRPVEPIKGSFVLSLGHSEADDDIRSNTPKGFALAFYLANL